MKDKATFHSSLALFLTSATGVFTRSLKTSESLPKKVNKREVWKGDTDRQDTGESQCQSQDWNWKTLKLLWRNRKTLPLTVRVLHSTDLSAMSSSSLAFIFSTSMAKSSRDKLISQVLESPTLYLNVHIQSASIVWSQGFCGSTSCNFLLDWLHSSCSMYGPPARGTSTITFDQILRPSYWRTLYWLLWKWTL